MNRGSIAMRGKRLPINPGGMKNSFVTGGSIDLSDVITLALDCHEGCQFLLMPFSVTLVTRGSSSPESEINCFPGSFKLHSA